jgi:hypothetical protein
MRAGAGSPRWTPLPLPAAWACLMESRREMASAVSAPCWTQNFGADAAFLAGLER